MKVFIDTNVILEYVLQREHYAEAKKVIAQCITTCDTMMMSAGGFYTMIFIVDKYFRKELLKGRGEARELTRVIMRKILDVFSVAEHNAETLITGIDNRTFYDLEDSCQYQLAQKEGCKLLLTFNLSDYPAEQATTLSVMTPQMFLDTYL